MNQILQASITELRCARAIATMQDHRVAAKRLGLQIASLEALLEVA